jgi:hypothetical protein
MKHGNSNGEARREASKEGPGQKVGGQENGGQEDFGQENAG